MNRFIDYFHQRIPLSAPAEAFLRRHGRVMVYDRLAYFMTPDVRMPYWCVVLDGLACGYTLDADGQRHIRWFATEMQGFAGVRHLYTPEQAEHYIQFTEVTTILCIRASRMREGKERFTEVSELLHLMNQRYKERQDKLVGVLQQSSTYGKFAAFMNDFPELAKRTTPDQQIDFINVGRSQFFEARKLWLSRKK
ncbi:hypothetical protein ACFQRK_00065 [Parapedobacter sp. GCM10030251]|uniref:hypothetical protein n=1 Tax=Parapedobacter sp. GCM10030251 TaxID=3273419 RepID=UPI00360762D1